MPGQDVVHVEQRRDLARDLDAVVVRDVALTGQPIDRDAQDAAPELALPRQIHKLVPLAGDGGADERVQGFGVGCFHRFSLGAISRVAGVQVCVRLCVSFGSTFFAIRVGGRACRAVRGRWSFWESCGIRAHKTKKWDRKGPLSVDSYQKCISAYITFRDT